MYGRDNKNALRNTVKGSDEAKNIRLISATALFQLVRIYCETKSLTVRNQINSVLQPRDYFVLDNLVELVFPQTDASIPDIDDTDDYDVPIGTTHKLEESALNISNMTEISEESQIVIENLILESFRRITNTFGARTSSQHIESWRVCIYRNAEFRKKRIRFF